LECRLLWLFTALGTTLSPEVQKNMGLTGTVVDSGDGVTHIIPMVDGYVIGSCIKHVPLAGRDITEYIMRAIRDRGETLDSEDIKNVAKEIKDKFSYIADDPIKEIELFDQRVADKGKMIRLKTTSISTGKVDSEVYQENRS
jgi:actin-related protein 3